MPDRSPQQSQPSSRVFSTILTPDAGLRRRVARSGHALGALGVSLALQLPLSPVACVGIAAALVARLGWQLLWLRRGWRQCYGIRVFPGGAAQVLDGAGDWRPARLGPGSFVLGRLAWLNLELADGSRLGEPFCGNPRQCDNWRRLRVIYRHVGDLR